MSRSLDFAPMGSEARARALIAAHSTRWGHRLGKPASWVVKLVSSVGSGATLGYSDALSDEAALALISQYAPSGYEPLTWLVEAVQAGYLAAVAADGELHA